MSKNTYVIDKALSWKLMFGALHLLRFDRLQNLDRKRLSRLCEVVFVDTRGDAGSACSQAIFPLDLRVVYRQRLENRAAPSNCLDSDSKLLEYSALSRS